MAPWRILINWLPWVDGIKSTRDGGAESADGIDSFLNIDNREGWESW